jgi:polyphosphate kinase
VPSLSDAPQHRDGPLPAPPNLRDPALYLNRELSWLAFNRRVLHEALDIRTPLLERVKFLAIVASNLDEFFQVRVAGLRMQALTGTGDNTADKLTPEEQLAAIRTAVVEMLRQQSNGLRDELLPALAAHGVVLHDRLGSLSDPEQGTLRTHFRTQVLPALTTWRIDATHPFPQVRSLSLAIAVSLAGTDDLALVTIPPDLPRWLPVGDSDRAFLSLEHLIGAELPELFPGEEVLGWHVFRITRNTGLQLDDAASSATGDSDDLLALMEEEVQVRRFGEVVRLEVHVSMPRDLRTRLLRELDAANEGEGLPLTDDDLFEVFGPLDLSALMALAAIEAPELRDPPLALATPPGLLEGPDLFAALRARPLLLHHPYHSFHDTVEQLLAQAVDDPGVRSIHITLYRTGRVIAELLLQAAERGKQVTVLIELQARFDEENNISWAKRLQDAGVEVSYGFPDLKTHAKVMLIEREEEGKLRRYVHIGTGNYNARTARLYTDFGLLSADPDLGRDLAALFDALVTRQPAPDYRKLVVAPEAMKPMLLDKIAREAAHARLGMPARIVAKMNALVDPDVIAALYEASRAGVTVDLLVRGICCLRPGVPGASDRIRVVSIVGRFLEHSRAWWFQNRGAEECYIGSADWMPRNLHKRVEAAAPLEDPGHLATMRAWLERMLDDNRQAWDLGRDGEYRQRRPAPGEPERASQLPES